MAEPKDKPVSDDKLIADAQKDTFGTLQDDILKYYQTDKGSPSDWKRDQAHINAVLQQQHVLPNLELTGVDEATGRAIYTSDTNYGNGKMSFEFDRSGNVVQVTDQAGNIWKKNDQGSGRSLTRKASR